MKITLKDGSVMEFNEAVTVEDIAKQISEGLWRNAVCGKVNGELVDLKTVISEDAELQIITLMLKLKKIKSYLIVLSLLNLIMVNILQYSNSKIIMEKSQDYLILNLLFLNQK